MPEDAARTAPDAARFEREERLDSGGLGEVWRGTDRETGDPVAIKREPETHDASNDAEHVRAGFREELRWFRELAGGPTPGSLVRFVDGAMDDEGGIGVGSAVDDGGSGDDAGTGGGAYVVTEFLDGVRVDRYFDDDGASAPDAEPGTAPTEPGVDACRAVAPHVARAVDFLHRNGVLHLDVKPGNVVERGRGPPASGRAERDRARETSGASLPVLIDLNSAASREDGTDVLFHRDPYTPPELAPTELRDAPVTAASDVYALGKLCCFLLAGDAPVFEAESPSGWAATDPRDYGAECSEHLAAVVWRATQPEPADRYADAGAFADALRSALRLPDRAAELVDAASGRRIRVRPGDAIGRWTPDRRVPEVVLPDDERLLSPTHATLAWADEDGGWTLVDRSLNGTWVERAVSDGSNPDPDYALSEAGLERRTEADAPLPEPDPPTRLRLADGDRIAPVSPDAGFALRFDAE